MSPFDPRQFYEDVLQANGIITAFGVPDSYLKGFLSSFYATKPVSDHIVMAK